MIIELNNRLKTLAGEFGYTCIDLFTPLAGNDDLLPRKYSLDGLHLSWEGYRVWADAIRQYVK